jgi:hypothetical protein
MTKNGKSDGLDFLDQLGEGLDSSNNMEIKTLR